MLPFQNHVTRKALPLDESEGSAAKFPIEDRREIT